MAQCSVLQDSKIHGSFGAGWYTWFRFTSTLAYGRIMEVWPMRQFYQCHEEPFVSSKNWIPFLHVSSVEKANFTQQLGIDDPESCLLSMTQNVVAKFHRAARSRKWVTRSLKSASTCRWAWDKELLSYHNWEPMNYCTDRTGSHDHHRVSELFSRIFWIERLTEEMYYVILGRTVFSQR